MFTTLIMGSGVYLLRQEFDQHDFMTDDKQDKQIPIVVGVSLTLLLVVMNLFYNTLLINLRLLAKMKCVTFGLCIFDCANILCCFKCCVKPCQDRLFTLFTLFKWVVKAAIIGYTIHAVAQLQEEWDEDLLLYGRNRGGQTRLHGYLFIYMLQIPIFLIARFPIFLLFEFLTCCCDKGEDIDLDLDELKDRVISYDFVEYELGVLHNFQHHPVGRGELEFNRNLNFVRAQSIRQRQDQHPQGDQRAGDLNR